MSRLRLGLETLQNTLPEVLRGARVGLLAHAASRVPDGRHALAVLSGLDLEVVRLFGPEHGFFGAAAAGEKVGDSRHDDLEVISLYGARRAPDPAHLSDLDALVFDVQDVGVRAYTYLSTLKACLKRCAEVSLPLVLLDRPNPLGRAPYGAGVSEGFGSFVSSHDVRFVHGMTFGELGTRVAHDLGAEALLHVVKMTGYSGQPWAATDLPWHAPSPNLPTLTSAQLYPLTVFLEGTNLSEGRGTDAPFSLLGAPWLEGEALAETLNARLTGIHAEPVRFTPTTSKHEGVEVSGVRLTPTGSFDPLRAVLVLLREVRAQNSDALEWLGRERSFIDLLAGSDVLRRTVTGEASDDDFEGWLESGRALEDARVNLYSSETV